ncbi:MAG: aldose 1-epimerase family protein [Filimonas sp.]|nr:aldose 1-epimerase family protein [Filimonas sp.]
MITIENGSLTISIATKGAELQHIQSKETGLEYMWSGDPAFWGKKSPVLFPIVGGLKNNQYLYKEQAYTLGRHGFARDMEFTVSAQASGTATFTLTSSDKTRELYPFDFSFSVKYTLDKNKVIVTYIVENKNNHNLLFSVGGHPAFKVPLTADTSFEDYYLKFNQTETAGKWPLSPEGLIENKPVPFLENTDELPLQKSLFYKDALVFKKLRSTAISILNKKNTHGLTVRFDGFPFMGIWSAKDADFVCIEPWYGIADHVGTSGNLFEKEGINQLAPDTTFSCEWSVEVV